jgi:hypothetical protein
MSNERERILQQLDAVQTIHERDDDAVADFIEREVENLHATIDEIRSALQMQEDLNTDLLLQLDEIAAICQSKGWDGVGSVADWLADHL